MEREMETAIGLVADYVSPCNAYKFTFDDDGRVAYAYLKHDGRIVGDVWIYNRCPSPAQPEWTDRTKIPFANPAVYTRPEGSMLSTVNLDDLQVIWNRVDGRHAASIYLYGDLVATVCEGDRPGYSKYAAKDGPLAKRLVIADEDSSSTLDN